MLVEIASAPLEIAFVFLIGLISYYLEFLTFDGFIGGIVIGLPIILFGGVEWFLLLLLFLLIGSSLSRLGRDKKKEYSLLNEKSGVRGWPNVIANGLWPMIASIFYYLSPFKVSSIYWLIFFMGSLTSMMADTTATEIGMLSPSLPRLIYNPFKRVEKGISGGVTLLGFVSSLLVSIFFAGLGMFFLRIYDPYFSIAVILGGFSGNVIDSILGGTIQSKYRCIVCGKLVESPVHCGKKTKIIKGVSWINNHTVNFFSSLAGGVISIFFYAFFL